jgi:hypothetical protein
MKNLLLVLLFSFMTALALKAQTSLDSLVFKKINQYRASLYLTKLQWNDTIYLGAKHHTDYVYLNNSSQLDNLVNGNSSELKSGHEEDNYLHGIESESFETRARKYHFDEECVTIFAGNMSLRDEVTAGWIVQSWIRSGLHNRILTDPKSTKGAVSCMTEVISDISKEDKENNLKYGKEDKPVIYVSSTFDSKK